MKKILYSELFLIIILGFVVSYKVAEKAGVTQKIIYTSIKKIEIKETPENISVNTQNKNKFKAVTGKIFKKYGYIFINNKKASLNDTVKIDDVIKTSSYSYVIIKFSNGVNIKINPDSELKIRNTKNSLKPEIISGNIRKLNNDELKQIVNNYDENLKINFDITYSKNSKILNKALNFLKNKKGKKAIVVLSKIAKKDPYASFLVGKILYEGIGIKKNTKTAVKWFKISAKENFPSAVEYLKSL